ncbi:MAG: NAD-dependent epimerase/dehydratase family protein [Myxococcota bacterium]|nr:NAD-dependent epimerase/dehydratase family protein [Myxococcota bacterium]
MAGKKSNKTYLMTGATGFLGRHVLETLEASGTADTVAILRSFDSWEGQSWVSDLSRAQAIEAPLTAVEMIAGQLADRGLEEVDGLFHCAGLVHHSRREPGELYETNVEGTLAMVRLAARYQARMVFVSTSGVVGCFESESEWADEHSAYRPDPVKRWPYYDSKLSAERQARDLARELGVELVVIRPPVLLGPGDHRFRSTGHIIKMLRKKLPFLIQGGIHFIDVRDASRAMVRAMWLDSVREVYHLVGTDCGITDFFDMVKEVSGVEPPRAILPYRAAHTLASAAEMANRFLPGHGISVPDPVVVEMASRYWGLKSRYAQKDLDYNSREPLQTLADTVVWLRANHPELSAEN